MPFEGVKPIRPLLLDEWGRCCYFLVWFGSRVVELKPRMMALMFGFLR